MPFSNHVQSSSKYIQVLKKRRLVQEPQHYPIPLEIIVKIFTHLDDFEDFKKCWGLCKEVRDYIFKTPKIMRKFVFNFFDRKEIEEVPTFPMPYDRFMTFLNIRGCYILNLAIKCSRYSFGLKCLRKFLNCLPNIEYFEFFVTESNAQRMGIEYPESSDNSELLDIPTLTKLNHLKVTHKFLNVFIGKVTNLTRFYVGEPQGGTDKTKNITYFMNQQKNLEEFWFINEDYGLKRFTMDISPGFKFQFKLKSFSADRECENFPEFCELFADDLEEMYLYMQPDPKLFEVLQKFKKLKNLRLPIRSSKDLFTSIYSGWELPSVENFHPILNVKLSTMLMRFPNVKHIQCIQLEKDSGTFETIETVSVDYFDPKILETVSLPNWKILNVNERVDEAEWNQILAVLPNIETKLSKGFKTNEIIKSD